MSDMQGANPVPRYGAFESALTAYGLRYWEYDIPTHRLYRAGLTPEEARYGQYREHVPESYVEDGTIHPDDTQAYLEFYRKLQQGTGGKLGFRSRFADGTWGWFEIAYQVIFDEQGNPSKAIGIGSGISEKNIFKDHLSKTGSKSALMEIMLRSTCEYEFDYLSLIVAENGCAISFSALYEENFRILEDYPGILLKEVEHGNFDQADALKQAVAWDVILREVAQKGIYTLYATRRGADGVLQCKRYQFAKIKNQAQLILGTARDVTDIYLRDRQNEQSLAAAMEAAQAANQAKTEFLSRMTHDIRTPMNAIMGLTDLTFDDLVHPEMVAENLKKIKASGEYLMGLINDVLDMAKIEDGSMTLKKDPYPYSDFLLVLKTIFVPLCQKKNIHFEFEETVTDLTVNTDKIRINQIFCNVLSNAVKYTPEGGTVSYRAENMTCDHGMLCCDYVIRDTGIGMSEAFQKHMFQPFLQEDTGVSAQLQGTGLGLSITKKLVELMGGTIQVISKEGRGTQVRIHLELEIAQDATDAKQSLAAESNHSVQLAGKRVLLVEDHPLNAEIATRQLEKQHMQIEHAENGKIAVELFERSPRSYYDAVIMDIRMPVMNGIEAAKAIRNMKRPDAKTVPIVAMTANAYDEDVRRSFSAGMNAHLSKPINPDELFGTLSRAMREVSCAPKGRKKLLVVDDAEVNRATLRTLLSPEYALYEAKNGVEALEILEKDPGIAAVITDIQMPEMDGLELIRRIRSHPQFGRIAILANTQYGDAGQEERLLTCGADDFIYKPTTPTIVKMRLNHILKKYD